MPLAEASAKVRTGDPIDEEDDMAGPWWSGVIPIETRFGGAYAAADFSGSNPMPPQYAALEAHGIRTPRTVAVVGQQHALDAAESFAGRPFITKHNQGGKGLGVQLFRSHEAFDAFVDAGGLTDGRDGEALPQSPDGIVILQQYIEPAAPFITRVEIVDGSSIMQNQKLRRRQSEGEIFGYGQPPP